MSRLQKAVRLAGIAVLLAMCAPAHAAVNPFADADPKNTALKSKAPSFEANEGEFAYVLGPQNVVQIKIFGDAASNPIYRIDESGMISHTLIGRVRLGGLTVAEAEKLLEEQLRGDYIRNPHVTVFVLEHSHFSVLGEVRKPGTYEIVGRVSIIEALSMAGGFTPIGNPKDVKIIRKSENGETVIRVDTTRITDRGDMTAQVYLEADDVVTVPKSFF